MAMVQNIRNLFEFLYRANACKGMYFVFVSDKSHIITFSLFWHCIDDLSQLCVCETRH